MIGMDGQRIYTNPPTGWSSCDFEGKYQIDLALYLCKMLHDQFHVSSMSFNIIQNLLPCRRSITTSVKGLRASPNSTWSAYCFSSNALILWSMNATCRRDMSNLQLTLSSKFGLVNTCPRLVITISFGIMYPVAFQIPKTTSSTLSFQVLPGSSVNVQLNVMSPPLVPIKGRLGFELIVGRCCWYDTNELKKRMEWEDVINFCP